MNYREREKQRLLERMMRLCSLSEHCIGDIRKKVERVNPDWCDEIVGRLCKEGYIDEMRYARAFARDKSSLAGWGSAKIKVALYAKGIAPSVIEDALGEIDDVAVRKKLSALMSSKWKSLERESDPFKRKAKLFRYAIGRGYDYEQIKEEYDNIRGN
ncbi:MAG: RecX family transcriptional regulator [Bacteroidales bacterium]|nr:RecX family transcriptional regulator [Candidatus Cacconaster scatequi]